MPGSDASTKCVQLKSIPVKNLLQYELDSSWPTNFM